LLLHAAQKATVQEYEEVVPSSENSFNRSSAEFSVQDSQDLEIEGETGDEFILEASEKSSSVRSKSLNFVKIDLDAQDLGILLSVYHAK